MSGTITNPLVSQGSLNLLRGSLIIPNYPALNVTAPFLGKDGIELALEGDATTYHDTLTGGVPSPQPYQVCQITLVLLRSQALANAWKLQYETTTLIGDTVARGDASTLGNYPIVNCAITGLRPVRFAGQTPDFVLMLRGYYNINNNMWGV